MSGEDGGEQEDRTDDGDILGIPGDESEGDESQFIQNPHEIVFKLSSRG